MHSLKLNFAEKNGVHLKKPTLSIGWTWIEEEDALILFINHFYQSLQGFSKFCVFNSGLNHKFTV